MSTDTALCNNFMQKSIAAGPSCSYKLTVERCNVPRTGHTMQCILTNRKQPAHDNFVYLWSVVISTEVFLQRVPYFQDSQISCWSDSHSLYKSRHYTKLLHVQTPHTDVTDLLHCGCGLAGELLLRHDSQHSGCKRLIRLSASL